MISFKFVYLGHTEELSTLDVLLVLRVMRLVKIIASIRRFKVILMTIMNIGPSIATYGGVIFVSNLVLVSRPSKTTH